MGNTFLLTGRPGAGKTTVVRAVATRLGARAGGFYTQEIREKGRRTGFRLIALDGPTGMLAGVNVSSRYRVGRYRVCLDDLESVGVESLWRALAQPDVAAVIVDEIGKMELFSSAFREAVSAALDGSKPVVATIMAGSQPWVDAVKARPDITLVEVTLDNRRELPELVWRWLQMFL
jgi:nucleoside-triphosphatase